MTTMKKDHMENKNNSQGIGGGFLLGLLIGILLTLLITTKKGREILRDIVDKIINKITALDREVEEIDEMEDFEGENDYIDPPAGEIKKEENQKQNIKILAHAGPAESREKQEKIHKRLFVRKPPQKS